MVIYLLSLMESIYLSHIRKKFIGKDAVTNNDTKKIIESYKRFNRDFKIWRRFL